MHYECMSKFKSRQLHLVDVDNLTGGPTKDLDTHKEIREWYDIHSDRKSDDLCFVAMSHYSAFAATKAWEGSKVIWASGNDGADLALINTVEETKFSGIKRVCLGSGDWIFKFALSPFVKNGIDVSICCRENSLSKSLKKMANEVTYISNYSNKNFVFLSDNESINPQECEVTPLFPSLHSQNNQSNETRRQLCHQ